MRSSQIKTGSFDVDFTYSEKFKFFSCSSVFSPDSYLTLQQAFIQLPWKKKQTEFYKQYETLISPEQDNSLSLLYRKEFYLDFKKKVEEVLRTELRDEIRIIAHKLVTADEIGVHNDFCDPSLGFENYRFIFQFAFTNQSITGGDLYFLSSPSKMDIIKKYPHDSNTGICFEITPRSYHYVSAVKGVRYTLIMYLWDKHRRYDGSGTRVK